MMELLERDSFLRELDTALKDAVPGQGRVVLVSGEAGIGKTSLVEHFTRAHQDSIRVLWGACDSLFAPRPLGPLHDIAMQLEGELPTLLNSNADRQTIFSACLVELQDRPTIVVFEDVHWADEATLDLIKFLGRRIRRTPSLIVLTYRDDELGPEHPLRLVLGDLPGVATNRLQLLPLSKSSVYALASAENQAEQANKLFDITSGNPFFITEVLASKGEDMPATIRDAVLARATRLSPSARVLLEAAAVIGLRAEPWLLSNITGAESAKVEECVAGGMLQFQGDDYAFRHELARQAILKTISPERRLALHRMILSVLKESPLTRDDLARLANHAEGTKDVSAVLEYAPAAAQQASAATSHREAIALYELALRFADSLPPAMHARMLEAYIIELLFANRAADTVIILEKAIELWHSIGDRLMEGDKWAWLTIVRQMIGQKAEAEQASQSAITILEALPPSAALARAYRAQCFIRMEDRDCAEAVIWGEKAIALAEHFNDTDTLARVCNYAGCAMMVIDYERGCALMERSLAIGREANLPFAFAGTLTNFSQMLVELYQFADAERYLAEGIAYTTEHDDDYHHQGMLTLQALMHLFDGRWAEGIETILKILQQPNVDFVTRTYALLTLGRLYVRRGDSTALAVLDKALALSVEADAIVRLGIARAARAEMAWLKGDNNRAREEVRAVYDMAVSKEHPWITGELSFWRWRAGDDFSPPAWIAKPFALQIAGDWRGAAEDWEQRGCPYEQAMALTDGDETAQLAALEIFERLGAKPAMEKLKQKMRAQGMRGIPRGPRSATRQNRFGLTTREMEVLECLVEGLSNNAIAKKLSLSTRTVEHHIASILKKMQVQSRNEAVALALKAHLLLSE
ncbi:MAG TPA: AAA family ATPase [Anaerolineales bacterium]|nr:AAA family ATPase [Anaerolineales bacterium]